MKRDWVARLGVCLIAATVIFAGGLANAEPAPEGGKFKVVTTFTVVQDIAQNVAGDKADVVSITKPGAEIHNYQPTPGDIIRASDADLVLWNGLGLELWFEQFFERLGDVPSAVLCDPRNRELVKNRGEDPEGLLPARGPADLDRVLRERRLLPAVGHGFEQRDEARRRR
mgnify:CR=1 FL=1